MRLRHMRLGRLEGVLGEKQRRLQTSPVLSPRELAVLRNYAAGKDQREIAAELSVGEGTVKRSSAACRRSSRPSTAGMPFCWPCARA